MGWSKDESKIISSNNLIYWMFGVIDRNTKEARVRCVLNNRTKIKQLPIIKNMPIHKMIQMN